MQTVIDGRAARAENSADSAPAAADAAAGILWGWALWGAVFAMAVCLWGRTFLYQDGAAYLVAMLKYGSWLHFDPVRQTAMIATQAPAVFAMRAGVTDVPALALLFGLGLEVPRLISLALCYWLLPAGRKSLILWPILSVFAVAANAEFFVVSESHFAAELFWPVLILVVQFPTLGSGRAILLLALAALQIRTYESMVFMAPLELLALALAMWGEKRAGKWALAAVLALLFLAAPAFAVTGIFGAQTHDTAGSTLKEIPFVIDRAHALHLTGLWSLAALAVVFAAELAPAHARRLGPLTGILRARWLLWALLLSGLAIDAAMLADTRLVTPQLHMKARTFMIWMPPVLGLALLRAWWRPAPPLTAASSHFPVTGLVCAVIVLVQSLASVPNAIAWSDFRMVLRAELARNAGRLPFADTALARLSAPGPGQRFSPLFAPTWTLPQLSVIETGRGTITTLVGNPDTTHAEALGDADHPGQMPDLSRYGLTWSPALAGAR